MELYSNSPLFSMVLIATVAYTAYGLTGFGAAFIDISRRRCANLPVPSLCDMFLVYHRSERKS